MVLKNKKQLQTSVSSVVPGKTQVVFFNSFEEEAEYVAKQRAETPYGKRLTDVEELRKRVFNNQLLPDNSWKPVPRIFKIMPSHTDDDSQ